ncbi:lysylphosphatidylglycerol synthase transmembrane domain-containing protein [Frigidibacter sp. MR17.24]|uniref:lysylphosphatidylglycerol synthase transmembrane domain-containing protein n=1 Tax=Frigidibacter sp. MR17.24 TaxID=3127345 RepID=UPI003012E5CD
MLTGTIRRQVPMRLIRLVLPFVLLALLWHLLDGPEIVARLSDADPLWLSLSMVAALLQFPFLAFRWRLTAGALGHPIPRGQAVKEYFVAQLVNQTLPGGMLGDAARVVRTQKQASLGTATGAVVIERLAGQVTLLLVTLAGLVLAHVLPGGVVWPEGTATVVAWCLGAAAVVLAVAALAWRTRPDTGRRLASSLRRAVFARGIWPRQVILSLGVVACNLSTFYFAARAIGVTLPPEAAVTLVPLVLTAMLVPLTIAGWGFREGAAAGLLPLAGVASEPAVAASIVFGAVILAASLPGVFWLAPADEDDEPTKAR